MNRSLVRLFLFWILCSALSFAPASAAIVHHTVNYTGTVAGGAVSFDFTDGSVVPGGTAPLLGMRLIPSNGGSNMQIQFLSGSGGGVVITTGAPSFLAQKYDAGTMIDGSIPTNTTSLPGFSTEAGVGTGKIRFFGSGNFASGERGYVGMRFDNGTYYGWAEVSAIDAVSFTVYQFAYEDSGAPIAVGDIGITEGVKSITRNGIGNSPIFNWPAGTWYVAAVQLDASGNLIGGLSEGFDVTLSGSTYPAFVDIEMAASGSSTDRIRVFRNLTPISPGDNSVEYADYLCDNSGGVAAICDATGPSPVGGGQGLLPDGDFVGVATVPDGSRGLAAITRGGLGNALARNWPAGTWYVRGILLNRAGRAVGALSQGFQVTLSGSTYPAFVASEMFGSAADSDRIRIFRAQAPISPGDVSIEFADFLCADVPAICDPISGASYIDGNLGALSDKDFLNVAAVPDGSIGVATIERNGLGNSPAWNWPAGYWYVRAVMINAAGAATDEISLGFEVSMSGNTYPAFVRSQMFANATPSQTLRVFRSSSPIQPGDTGVEFADYGCDDGAGGLASHCDALSGASEIGGGVGPLRDPDFTGVGQVPSTVVAAPDGPVLLRPQIAAYPNPFNPRVTIRFVMPQSGAASLKIYDAAGHLVRNLVRDFRTQGEHISRWDGTDDAGRAVGSGVYFARVVSAQGVATQKVALIR